MTKVKSPSKNKNSSILNLYKFFNRKKTQILVPFLLVDNTEWNETTNGMNENTNRAKVSLNGDDDDESTYSMVKEKIYFSEYSLRKNVKILCTDRILQ